MIRVVIDSRLKIDLKTIPDTVAARLRAAFTHENEHRHMMRRIGHLYGVPTHYETWQNDGDFLSLPRGGMARLRGILRDAGIVWRVVDRRERGTGPRDIRPHRVALDAHQVEMVEAAVKAEQGIIRCGTGGGKTTALIALAARLDMPTLVLVHQKGLLSQWRERAIEELGMEPSDVGVIGGGKRQVCPLSIGIVRSVASALEDDPTFRTYWGCVMADECHLFAGQSLFDVVDQFPARYRFGTTADERRKDRKEFLVHDLMGAVLTNHPYELLVARGVIVPVEARVIPTEFARPEWYGIADEEDEEDEREIDFDRLLKAMASDDDRNALALDQAAREHEQGGTIVMLCHQRDHVLKLAAGLAARGVRSGALVGDNHRIFEQTKRGLRDGTLRAAVGTYQAAGTGIDVPRLDAIVCVTPIAGNEQLFAQLRGRACRKIRVGAASGTKMGARIYILWDKGVYPGHLANVRRWNGQVRVLEDGSWKDRSRR